MHALPPRQAKTLAAIIESLTTTGAAPTQGRLAEMTGIGPSISTVLTGLRERGYVTQAWEAHGAPWLPLRNVDGREVKVRALVEVAP